jgi:hypothetical protein
MVIMITIVLVVFVFPIVLGMPALGVGIPPPVAMAPAIFASFREIMTGAVGFGTAVPVVLDSLVEPMVGAINAFLAVVVISAHAGSCAQCGKGRQGCNEQCGFAEVVYPPMWQVHLLSLL